jgi:hypothetical protein
MNRILFFLDGNHSGVECGAAVVGWSFASAVVAGCRGVACRSLLLPVCWGGLCRIASRVLYVVRPVQTLQYKFFGFSNAAPHAATRAVAAVKFDNW